MRLLCAYIIRPTLSLLQLHQRVQGQADKEAKPLYPSSTPDSVPCDGHHPGTMAQRTHVQEFCYHQFAFVRSVHMRMGSSIRPSGRPNDLGACHETAIPDG